MGFGTLGIGSPKARGRAAKMMQPFEKTVHGATPSLDKVPAEHRAELEAMEDLGDEELWQMTKCRMAASKQRRLESLLDKNQREELTDREREALAALRVEGDRLMSQRSFAFLLLKYRGHQVPKLGDVY